MPDMPATRALALFLLLASAGCRSAAAPPTVAPTPSTSARATTPSGDAAPTADASQLPPNIRWVRSAAEYQAIVVQTYRAATRHVERAAYGRAPGTWAVILDADETVVSNLPYQEERARLGQSYSSESWYAWVRRREATPLPGAAAFLQRVHALGGRIAIVTNRRAAECDDTKAVFARHALIYDAMLCRPYEGPSDKNPRFEAVARGVAMNVPGPIDVLAFLGDNIQDFPGLSQDAITPDALVLTRFGEEYFVLPNPMYGSWER